MLDVLEQDVLERKKYLLQSHVLVDDFDLQRLVAEKAIGTKARDEIKALKSTPARVDKLFAVLKSGKGSLDSVCKALERNYPWVADDIWAEIKLTKGKLEIEDSIMYEASYIMHREFGCSKRLAEVEKKALHNLLARRTQHTKAVWFKQIDRINEMVALEGNIKGDIDAYAKELADKVGAYLEENRQRVKFSLTSNSSSSLMGTRGAIDGLDEDAIQELKSRVTSLVEMVTQVQLDQEVLKEERDRTMKILKAKDKNMPIDVALIEALAMRSENSSFSLVAASNRDQELAMLDGVLRDLEEEYRRKMAAKDLKIAELKQTMMPYHEKMKEYSDLLADLKYQLQMAKEERDEYQFQFGVLDRSKRLNYLYDRDTLKDGTPGSQTTTLVKADVTKKVHRPIKTLSMIKTGGPVLMTSAKTPQQSAASRSSRGSNASSRQSTAASYGGRASVRDGGRSTRQSSVKFKKDPGRQSGKGLHSPGSDHMTA